MARKKRRDAAANNMYLAALRRVHYSNARLERARKMRQTRMYADADRQIVAALIDVPINVQRQAAQVMALPQSPAQRKAKRKAKVVVARPRF